ncbi:MAG: hypothetical protein J6K61_01840 [Clostridia bacterium]|nr:hypothetical protein [Clostridia bacterium]
MKEADILNNEKKLKKAVKCYRRRHLRGFFIWLWGLLSFVPILVVAIAVTLSAIPVKNFVGEEQAGKVADGSILEAIMQINSYTFDEVPIAKELINTVTSTEVFNGKQLGDLIHIKTDDIGTVKIMDFVNQISSNPGEMIEIVASIDTLIGLEALGDFGALSSFSTYEEVEVEIDVNDPAFTPALYYYQVDGAYVRAFDNDKNRIAPEGAILYYGALAYMPIPDAVNLISESLGRESLTEILTNLGGAEMGEDSVIVKLLGSTTINGVGNITLSDIELSTFIPEENNKDLYQILRSACVDDLGPNDPITLQNVANGFDMQKIKLTGFLDKTTYATFYNILCDALDTNPNDNVTVKPEDITIAQLGSFDITNTKLSALLGEKSADNETIYDILCSACGVEDYRDLTINHLQSFSLDGVYLEDVLPYSSDNADIYETIMNLNPEVSNRSELQIKHLSNLNPKTLSLKSVGISGEVLTFLSKALNMKEDEIKVNNLSTLTVDAIPLSAVLPYSGNETTYKLLLSALTGKNQDTVTVGDLKTFNLNSVKLIDILGERTDNLYDVLAQASGVSKVSLTVGSLSSSFDIGRVTLSSIITESTGRDKMFDILVSACGLTDASQLKVSSLTGFNASRILLDAVLHEPEQHVKWLMEDACNKAYETITINDLTSSTFDIDRVKISHLIDDAAPTLQTILSDACNGKAYAELLFKDISSEGSFNLNSVKLSSLVTENTGNEIVDKLKADSTVTIGNMGTKLTAILPTVKLSSVLTQDTGNGLLDSLRKDSSVTIGNVGEKLNQKLSVATIGQLIEDGIITVEVTNPEVLAMTLDQAIEKLNMLP